MSNYRRGFLRKFERDHVEVIVKINLLTCILEIVLHEVNVNVRAGQLV